MNYSYNSYGKPYGYKAETFKRFSVKGRAVWHDTMQPRWNIHIRSNVIVMWQTNIANVQIPTGGEIVTGTVPQRHVLFDGHYGLGNRDRNDQGRHLGAIRRATNGATEYSRISTAFYGGPCRERHPRQSCTSGEHGNIEILPSGPYSQHPAAPINVYPVRVSQLTQLQRLRTGGGSVILVSFVIRSRCGENVTVAP